MKKIMVLLSGVCFTNFAIYGSMPPLPPPPAPSLIKWKAPTKLQYERALDTEKMAGESIAKLEIATKYLKGDNPFAYIDESLRENCNVTPVLLKLNANEDLSCIEKIIDAEYVENKDVAVFFDFDNTITRNESGKEIFPEKHKELLNHLTDRGIDWCIITASRQQGPKDKYEILAKAKINLSRMPIPNPNKEIHEYLPSILSYKDTKDGKYKDGGISRNGNKFDLATIEYISYGNNIVLAALPEKNKEFMDDGGTSVNSGGTFVHNDPALITRYEDAKYHWINGYQKPAAMRYFLKKLGDGVKKKLIIVVDDTARNIKDFVDDAKAKLLGNVADEVKLIAIWYEPTAAQKAKPNGVELKEDEWDKFLFKDVEFTEEQLNTTISKDTFEKSFMSAVRTLKGMAKGLVDTHVYQILANNLPNLVDRRPGATVREIVDFVNKNSNGKINQDVKRALANLLP